MLRSVIRRPCAGCYKIISSNNQVSQGKSLSYSLRPLVTKQNVLGHPNWWNTACQLRGFNSRCLSTTVSTANSAIDLGEQSGAADTTSETETIESSSEGKKEGQVRGKKDYSSNLFKKKLFKKTLQSYEDRNIRRMYMQIKNQSITKNDVMGMSEDITDVYFRRPQGKNSYAFLMFETEELKEKNLISLSKREDVIVEAVGQFKASDNRMLSVKFSNPDVTVEDVQAISEDIETVEMRRRNNAPSALVQFKSAEATLKNYRRLKQSKDVANVSFVGDKFDNRHNLQLKIYEVAEGVTEEDLLKLSEDILEVRFYQAKDQRIAFLTFGTEEDVGKNFKLLHNKMDMKLDFVSEKTLNDHRRKLWFRVDKDMQEKDILALSDDILKVNYVAAKEEDAPEKQYFLEFLSEEIAAKNCRMLKQTFHNKVQPKHRNKKNSDFSERKISLGFFDKAENITKEQVLKLSKYMIDAFVIDKDHQILVIAEFISPEQTLEAYKRWRKDDLNASWVGNMYLEKRSRTLYLNNINAEVTRKELLGLSGDIIDVQLMDGETKYAFLEFESSELARTNYKMLKQGLGSTLHFSEQRQESEQRHLYLPQMGEDTTETSLKSLSDDICSADVLIDRKGSKYGILEFVSKDKALEHYTKLNEAGTFTLLKGETIHDQRMRKLFATVLDPAMTEEEIKALSPDILLVKMRVGKGSNRTATIEFVSREMVDKNWEKLNNAAVAERMKVSYMDDGPNSQKTQHDTEFKLWIANIDSKSMLEEDLSDDHIFVHVKEDYMGRKFAFVGFSTEEAATESMESLRAKGYAADWSQTANYNFKNTLRLIIDDANVTEEDIKNWSTDQLKVVRLAFRENLNKAEGLIEFNSEGIAENNFKALSSLGKDKGFRVFFTGKKNQEHIIDYRSRTLRLSFPNSDVTQNDIQELSEDILDVKLFQDRAGSYAYVEFENRQLAEKHCEEFTMLGLTASLQSNPNTYRTL